MANQLILASSSPRRLDLLRLVGVEPQVMAAGIDESVLPGEQPQDLVIRLCEAKACKVGNQLASRHRSGELVVLGADTIVVLDGDVLNKPVDASDARNMLSRLSGTTHEVLTGTAVVLVSDGAVVQTESEVVSSLVTMRPLTSQDIDQYLDSREPFGKAGAYAIQGYGAVFVTAIEGSFHNVVGLPLHMVERLLDRVGKPLLGWVKRS
jgi:septum formation protein